MLIRLGSVFETNNSGKCQVIQHYSQSNIVVKFLATGYVKSKVTSRFLIEGKVKDPMYPSTHGVGYVGVGEYKTKINNKNTIQYTRWRNMMDRCYSKKLRSRYPTYEECIVSPEWHNFQNFAKWFDENKPKTDKLHIYHLDKDYKVKGNKIYGPETCQIILGETNARQVDQNKWLMLRNPTGVVTPYLNVSKLCRENGLSPTSVRQMIRRERTEHRGWTLL